MNDDDFRNILKRSKAISLTGPLAQVRRDVELLVKRLRQYGRMGRPRKLDEPEVVRLRAQGFTGEQIAERFGTSERTVWRTIERMKDG